MENQIDLDAAERVFAESTDGTIGLEEEFGITSLDTLDLAPRFEELRAAASSDSVLSDAIAGELINSEIEIRSGRGVNLADALKRQQDLRSRLFALARVQGVGLSATGAHPWADYRHQQIIDTDHYRRVEDGLRWVASRNNTFSLHVHVGVKGADRAVRVCDRLRAVLPSLLAISASSPFVDGVDSGLHSVRTQLFTRSFPRCGIPDAFGSWEAYREYVDQLINWGSIVEYTQVWWSIRPHFSFGTVEVRICDAQPTAEQSDALASLIAACVLQATRDEDEQRPNLEVSGRLLEENLWRAIRYGLDGKLIDFDLSTEFSSAAVLDRLLEWTRPVRDELGIDPKFPAENSSQRQRRLIGEGRTMREVFSQTCSETASSYSGEYD